LLDDPEMRREYMEYTLANLNRDRMASAIMHWKIPIPLAYRGDKSSTLLTYMVTGDYGWALEQLSEKMDSVVHSSCVLPAAADDGATDQE
jgi:hypothetical protein